MARPTRDAEVDFGKAHNITAGLIARVVCPDGKQQVLLRDSDTKGLRVRITENGAKSFVFEQKLRGQTIRRTIGDTSSWSIDQARKKARQLSVLMDSGQDPRELERQHQKERLDQARLTAERTAKAAHEALTVGQIWQVYVAARKDHWGELHYRDHLLKASAGGAGSKRHGASKQNVKTTPGPLYPIMKVRLVDLDQAKIDAWAQEEGKRRPSSARLALRLLGVFLNWCSEHPDYSSITPSRNPTKSRNAKEMLGKPGVKKDVLLREQLPAWFSSVKSMTNKAHSVYLQVLLLTGARPGEVLALQWTDINMHWKHITIRDKIEGERTIPLTPYVSMLLHQLPRKGKFVFAGTKKTDTGDYLPMIKPNVQHSALCKSSGIDALTLHGLRRSFKSLSEWVELPVGIVAQIMGHKPSATAEKHYTVRPLDLLRLHHLNLEAWILEQANVPKPGTEEQPILRAA